MPTPTTKGERTRNTILERAIARFATSGFRGTSLADIARDAGLTPAAIYPYFPNKQSLFEHAVDADAAGLISESLSELLEGTFHRDFEGIFNRLLANLPGHPLARRILAGEEGTASDRLLDLPAIAQVRKGLTSALIDGQRDGSIRPDIDPEEIAAGLETVLMASLIATLQTGGRPDPRRATGLIALLDAALEAPGERRMTR